MESRITVEPRPTDVLFGRGNGVASWRGNVHYRQIIWKYKAEYQAAGRFTKAKVALKVLQDLGNLNPPGRFVEMMDEDTYCLVEQKRAIEKTCQALRERSLSPPGKNDFLSSDCEVNVLSLEEGICVNDESSLREGTTSKRTNVVKLVETKLDTLDGQRVDLGSDAVTNSSAISVSKSITKVQVAKKARKKNSVKLAQKNRHQRGKMSIPMPNKFGQTPRIVTPASSTVPWEKNESMQVSFVDREYKALMPRSIDFEDFTFQEHKPGITNGNSDLMDGQIWHTEDLEVWIRLDHDQTDSERSIATTGTQSLQVPVYNASSILKGSCTLHTSSSTKDEYTNKMPIPASPTHGLESLSNPSQGSNNFDAASDACGNHFSSCNSSVVLSIGFDDEETSGFDDKIANDSFLNDTDHGFNDDFLVSTIKGCLF